MPGGPVSPGHARRGPVSPIANVRLPRGPFVMILYVPNSAVAYATRPRHRRSKASVCTLQGRFPLGPAEESRRVDAGGAQERPGRDASASSVSELSEEVVKGRQQDLRLARGRLTLIDEMQSPPRVIGGSRQQRRGLSASRSPAAASSLPCRCNRSFGLVNLLLVTGPQFSRGNIDLNPVELAREREWGLIEVAHR